MVAELPPGLAAVLIGIGATLAMDIWNYALRRVLGVRSLDYCLLGRWLRHMPSTFRHASIAQSEARSHECSIGWIAHYSIGVSLALGFVVIASSEWLANPTLLPALMYGIATVVFPFFMLQPALGLGIASSKAAKPAHARLKSMVTHTVFGCGLYVCALVLAV